MAGTAEQLTIADRFEAAQVDYRGKIRTFARNSVNQIPGFDLEDIEQELLVVLWQCVIKYDPNKGASFNTLFQGCARNKVITLIRHGNTKGRKASVVSLDDEAVRLAVDEADRWGSAEDIVLANLSILDRFDTDQLYVACAPVAS